MTVSSPMLFEPWLRPMPWGGHSLAKLLGFPVPAQPIGEAWLLSDHPLHQTKVIYPTSEQLSLQMLIKRHHATMLNWTRSGRFPLLIKILDAQQNLSIQVHPDDQLAKRWAPGEGGKTEAWVVLSTSPGAAIFLGLKPGIDLSAFELALKSGKAAQCLVRYEPQPGDAYFVPAGAVHALGQGVIVLEVQQTSDATFRLDDWGRVGTDGKPRPHHIEEGLACTKLATDRLGLQQPFTNSDGAETLVECNYFKIRRWRDIEAATVQAPAVIIPWSRQIIPEKMSPDFKHGYATFIPADLKQVSIRMQPDTTLFEIRWPVRN